jgi:NAD+ synthetase
MQNKKINEIQNALLLGIKDYFRKNNFKRAVIGLSGGLDSSVAAYLTAKAIGSENVTAILMPEKGVTKVDNYNDALKIARKLRIKHYAIPINNAIDFFDSVNEKIISKKSKKIKEKLNKKNLLAIANSKARIRMTILYYFANLNNALVIGTSDKSEIALGYTTKYGDNASDILVIGDLWKTQVIMLGEHLGVPENILNKKPSAELIIGVDAEKELGAPYEILDRILEQYIEHDSNIKDLKRFKKEIVKDVVKRVRLNEHKRRTAMLIRVSERSFHNMEWRVPVTNRFREK